MTESSDYESVQVFIGVDVGKDTHHAVAINRSGKRLFDKALPNDENKLRSLISDLKQHGQILLVVDQPATIGALPVAVARSEGVLVGYLPGLAMRRIADLHAGEAKTDARDAAIIAEAARTLPHALRTLKLADVTSRFPENTVFWFFACRASTHGHFVSHDKSRVETNTKLTDQLAVFRLVRTQGFEE